MLFIVLSHWGGHGSWVDVDYSNLFNSAYLQYTQFLGELGNFTFVLITGYFLSTREEFKWGGGGKTSCRGCQIICSNYLGFSAYLWTHNFFMEIAP